MIVCKIAFGRYYDHLVDVRLEFVAPCNAPTLWLPTWIAGSYLIREFSKNITNVCYRHHDDTCIADKVNKNTFCLTHIKAGERVVVDYEVYCHDLSVRTAFVDNRRIFANFSSLLLMVKGSEHQPCQVSLNVPSDFLKINPKATIASGLKSQSTPSDDGLEFLFEPMSAFELYDYPFEIGEQSCFEFKTTCQDSDICHRFFIAGKHDGDLTRLSQDIKAICQSYVDWLGDTPFADYTFMTMVTGDDYGGLEHINSTALVSPRTDLPSVFERAIPSESYQRFLGLCSHEYFHAWWVKSVRPDVMMTSDLQTEAYTPLLWVFEGFTSYFDDLMLFVAGVIDQASYFKLVEAQINRYHQTDGKVHQSVAQSSFDTWIKLYRPDDNTQNQSVSYYNKGALVALCLDLTLLWKTDGKHRLFDVVKIFYGKSKQSTDKRFGMTDDELGGVISSLMGQNAWQEFYQAYVVGVEPLPLVELLGRFGATLQITHQEKLWGMRYQDDPAGLKITHLSRDSMASRAGLSVGDVIVAIDGIRASKERLLYVHACQNATRQPASVVAFRRDELMTVVVDTDTPMRHDVIKIIDYDEQGWLAF